MNFQQIDELIRLLQEQVDTLRRINVGVDSQYIAGVIEGTINAINEITAASKELDEGDNALPF